MIHNLPGDSSTKQYIVVDDTIHACSFVHVEGLPRANAHSGPKTRRFSYQVVTTKSTVTHSMQKPNAHGEGNKPFDHIDTRVLHVADTMATEIVQKRMKHSDAERPCIVEQPFAFRAVFFQRHQFDWPVSANCHACT
jgi:hypothetical protein